MSSSSSFLPTEEPKLSIQSFHQCSSLVSIKLSTTNFLMWRSQIILLVQSLGVYHHLTVNEKPAAEIENEGKKVKNDHLQIWRTNDGLLTSWLLGTIKEDVLSLVMGETGTAFTVWVALEQHLLPITIEKESNLKRLLMGIKKGSRSIDEYLKDFKNICDNLAAIQKPVSDIDKVLQFASGLGNQYIDFRTAMLSKPPLPSFQQFLLALQGHEQTLLSNHEEEKRSIEHAQAFFSQRGGRGRARKGGGRTLVVGDSHQLVATIEDKMQLLNLIRIAISPTPIQAVHKSK
ncbi:hypothetical protein ACOSQ2_008697 [Xanthoceras sorbifolium]